MNFDEAFDKLLGHEGAYANHPSDPGAETMWGVTAKVARANGYTGSMRQLPRAMAKDIYRRLYWAAVRADELPPALAFHVFDAAVNSGPGQAVKWLQRVLGVKDDGALGPMTLAAAGRADATRLAALYSAERLIFMTDLPTWAAFGRGWAKRIASNLKLLGA